MKIIYKDGFTDFSALLKAKVLVPLNKAEKKRINLFLSIILGGFFFYGPNGGTEARRRVKELWNIYCLVLVIRNGFFLLKGVSIPSDFFRVLSVMCFCPHFVCQPVTLLHFLGVKTRPNFVHF